MRSFLSRAAVRIGPGQAASLMLACATVGLLSPLPGAAQWPGVAAVRVLDAVADRPVVGARIEVEGAGMTAFTNGTGAAWLRGVQPGSITLLVGALGYASQRITIEVDNGREDRVTVRLLPRPVQLDGLLSELEASGDAGAWTISRTAVEASAARTLGDLLQATPGIVIREDTPGGRQAVSVRGSATDAVLVLVDGVPANDPVTGEADLSLVPASIIERVEVLPGARSARYGPRARAGVVSVQTRTHVPNAQLEATGGSLGFRSIQAEAGRRVGDVQTSLGLGGTGSSGEFSFDRPDRVGGGSGRRTNAHLSRWHGWASAATGGRSSRVRVRADHVRTARGIPGKTFQQADSAEQRVVRSSGVVTAHADYEDTRLEGTIGTTWLRSRYRDPAPPVGVPFDEETRVFQGTVRLEAFRAGRMAWRAGGSLDLVRVRAEALGDDREKRPTFAGVHGGLAFRATPTTLFTGTVRLDGGSGISPVASHEVAVSWLGEHWRLDLAHRSSFSPPALSDQFLREGVGVRANPDLAPERVPSEWHVGAEWRSLPLAAGASLFAGDVRGMIVWLPDFRFVWSPRNTDVRRRGGEAWVDARFGELLSLHASYTYARITYDRPGSDTVQVAYRPRHVAGLSATWTDGPWTVGMTGRFTGTRYPVPSPINALPPFWSWSMQATREWSWAAWSGDLSFRVDRLFDERDTLIFGFPSPGRTAQLTLRLRRRPSPATEPLS